MIFTNDERIVPIKKDLNNLNCSLFDVNSVFTSFDALEKRINMKNSYISCNIKPIEIENDEIFTFEYIKESIEPILPLFLSGHIEYPTKDEIFKFNKFLLDRFSSSKEFKLLIEQLFVNIKIPCEILIKYYLRAWTLESSFYKEMNYCLSRNLGKDYETYIKVLYHSLLNKYILPANENKLFRGTRINKIELDYIKNIFKNKKEEHPSCICLNKAFLSSCSREDIALSFMSKMHKKENEEYVIFEIEKGIELDTQNASNTNTSGFREFVFEKEILFFPFSSFEINKMPEERTYVYDNENKFCVFYRIYLIYLGKYKNKMTNDIFYENNFLNDHFSSELNCNFSFDFKKKVK